MERRTRTGRQAGFTYVGLLVGVAILGAALAAVGSVWHTLARRDNEKQLLLTGHEFRVALNRYFQANQRFPMRLEDLLRDESQHQVTRYLRKIYYDPLTRGGAWGLVRSPNGQIVGVHSLAPGTPLKQQGFRRRDALFADKKKYSEWVFMADGQVILPAATAGAAPDASDAAP